MNKERSKLCFHCALRSEKNYIRTCQYTDSMIVQTNFETTIRNNYYIITANC